MKSLVFGLVMAAGLVLLALVPVRANVCDSKPVDEKLRSIFVSVDFNHATIKQAVAALATMSHELDPDHKGVQFVISPDAAMLSQPITLKLDAVPLRIALKYTCLLAGVLYKESDYAVSIDVTRVGGGDDLIKRTFHVDPSFVEAATQAGVMPSAQSQ